MTWQEYKDYSLMCYRQGCYDRIGCAGPAVLCCLPMALLLCACKTQYVPVETVRTEKNEVHDTIEISDTVYKEKTVRVVEADSATAAEYGIKLNQVKKAYLILEKELEREKSKQKEVHTDTVTRTDVVQVPYPVERKLSRWEAFCLDYGKVMLGSSVVLVIILLFLLARWLSSLRARRISAGDTRTS